MDSCTVGAEKALLAFERELEYLLKSGGQHLSNRLFDLLNNYEWKLKSNCYQSQLLKLGDDLKHMKEYSLARNHGFGRYLRTMNVDGDISVIIRCSLKNEVQLLLTLRAVVGDGFCQYNIALRQDKHFQAQSTREMALHVLHNLTLCMQAGLHYESLYWLVYNAITLSYSLARKLLSVNLQAHVIQYLVWNCVVMESCLPLMTVKYLPLRANLYTALCASYYALKQPLQAELFARRSLDKIHQLAQIEHLTMSVSNSSAVFTEATVKLGIMVFKRSVLETHKKTKSVLRPKVRPLIKDLLQSSWPRSPTERLLDEMFQSHSAQFMAIIEALSVHFSRPLEKKSPQPVTDLDEETVTDVYQELLTAGVDLALKGFEQKDRSHSLVSLAVKGSDVIPFPYIIQFIHLCYQVDCPEAFAMLASTAVELGGTGAISVKLLLAIDELNELSKQGAEDRIIWENSVVFLDFLCTIIADYSVNEDLLFDCSLLVWQKICDVYKGVVSYDSASCRSLLTASKSSTFLEVLRKMVLVLRFIKMPFFDPLFYGEVVLKYAMLLEAQADLSLSTLHKGHLEPLVHPFVRYDRKQLWTCLLSIEEFLQDISTAKENSDENALCLLHTELLNSLWRVKTKLSISGPPECPVENTNKPSSLRHKVKEREQRLQTWKKIVLRTTSDNVPIPTEADLREECGADHCQCALLLINLAAFSSSDKQTVLLQEAFSHLSSARSIHPVSTVPSNVPSPPVLLRQSPTVMKFSPAPFGNFPVSYYALYGRVATNGNAKVRFVDSHLPGLGIKVPAERDCVLTVSGLQPHTMYTFAVAAYGPQGQLIGNSIGCSTKPIIASYPLSHSLILGYLCQCAYQSNDVLAKESASIVWQQLVYPYTANERLPRYRLKQEVVMDTSLSSLHLFITSIFIQVQTDIKEYKLWPDCSFHSLLSTEGKRLELISKLLVALTLSGRINSYSYCLQAVVMCYTLLIPLIQQCAISHCVMKVLLQCHAVLQELPDNLLTSRHTIFGIHHMISSLSFCLVKVLSNCGQKSLLPTVVESSRFLLALTLPSTTVNHRFVSSGSASLQNPSLLSSTSTALTSTLSFTSQSSFMPIVFDKPNRQHKKRKKKTLTLNDDLTDEAKSLQYKVLGAYFISQIGLKSTEDVDLTGQEDPVFLHVAIRSSPVHVAYKEVMKFKRRPQYLEYFVHLCDVVMAEGKGELILNWSNDVFSWLAKRNEILLSAKTPQTNRPEQPKEPPPTLKIQQQQVTLHEIASKGPQNASTERANSALRTLAPVRPKSVRRTEMPLAVMKHRITRDDLSIKAVVVLQNLLPSIWRTSRCRRRLRAACTEEHPWRAQVNILLASCILENIYNQLKVALPSVANVTPHFVDDLLITPYPPSMPKEGNNSDTAPTVEDDHISKLLCQMVLHYQRASVLSFRGYCWVLLVNACRGLWNGLTILRNFINRDGGLKVSQLFGLSLKALYMTATHLMDMYQYITLQKNNQACSGMLLDESFLRQFVLLAIQVCFVHQHWEKTLALVERLKSITNIGEILNPMVLKAQQKLGQRIEQHSGLVRHKSIDPAAHLDIAGYDLYDKIGHSFGMTNVRLCSSSEETNRKEGSDVLLSDARKLAAAFFNQHSIFENAVSLLDVQHIINGYDKAINNLIVEREVNLAIAGMHEMGDLLYFSGQLQSAAYWWIEGLKCILQCENPLQQWRSLPLKCKHVANYANGGVLACKLSKYIHFSKLDMRLEYTHLAAHFFKGLLEISSLSHPSRDIEYALYNVSMGNILESEVFYGTNSCKPSLLLASLHYAAKEFIDCRYHIEVLPLLCFYEYVAVTYVHSVHHTVLARTYKVHALTQLALYSDAVKCLKELVIGTRLPQLTSEYNFNVNNYGIAYEFDERAVLNNSQNIKVLSFVIGKQVLSLKEVYGSFSYGEFVLSKAGLLIELASSCQDIPSEAVITGQCCKENQLEDGMTAVDVKIELLRTAEELLFNLLNHKTYPLNFFVRSYHLLAKIALSLCHGLSATQLALAAIREMQMATTDQDVRLWLTTHVMLVQSFAQVILPKENLLKFSVVCADAIKECQIYGDSELYSQLLYISACHQFKKQLPSLDEVTSLVQACICKLERAPYLSCTGKLLKVRATLLLAEVLSNRNVSPEVLVEIFSRVIAILQDQLMQESQKTSTSFLSNNCYKAQLPLLVEAHMKAMHVQLHESCDSYLNVAGMTLEEMIEEVKEMALSCPSFKSVLLAQLVLICRRNCMTYEATQSLLTEALSSVLPFDYTLCHILYCLLGEEMAKQSNEAMPDEITASVLRQAEHKISHHDLPGEKSQLERQWTKEKKKEAYRGWCAIKSAGYVLQLVEQLHHLSCELHNKDMTTPLTDMNIPDIAVFDLCCSTTLLESLVISTDVPAISLLLPFSQEASLEGCKCTWFDLLGYFQLLLKQCFVPSSPTNCSWQLHVHHLTSDVLPKATAIFLFLQSHCSSISKVCTPITSLSGFLQETEHPFNSYLTATEGEVTILWYSWHNNKYNGLVALNDKAVKGPVQAASLHAMGITIHYVTVDYAKLSDLRSVWHDLAKSCSIYLTQQATRPLSRSPSRMRKRSLEQSKQTTPPDLLRAIENAVVLLLDTLELSNIQQGPLHVEPHMISSINRALKPALLTTEKGDAYYFFCSIFSGKHN